MLDDEIAALQHAIQDLGFAWQAGLTALSNLSLEDREYRLGLRPEFAAMQGFSPTLANSAPQPKFPPAWDWRSVKGNDWTTPVHDQGKCAACIAFGTVAVLETMLKVLRKDISFQPDLSEAHLFFAGCGRCCQSGWWPTEALEYARIYGVPNEECFPYQDRDLPGASSCADWQKQAVRAMSWQEVADVAARKAWIAGKGPMLACLGVYDDLFHYVRGVYRHAQGNLLGYHAVCVAGYSEAEQAWICKNSWGTDWGEAGWFKIGYGEAGIDTSFAMYGVEAVLPAAQPQPITPKPATPPAPVPGPQAERGCNMVARLLTALRGN